MLVNQLKYGLIFLVACLFSDLHANEIIIRQIPVAEQLPSNTVYRMFQDRNGFVWFGTPNGFCRYDGYEMKNFRSEVAGTLFPSNYITGGFAEDTLNHTLWIGTEKGVLILDEQSHKITLLDTALLGESPIRQIEYAGNAMWICSDFGLYLYGSDKTLKKKYLPEAGSIHIDRQGTVRVTVWNGGLYYLDKATDTFVPYPRIGPNNNPHKIFQDAAGQCWICTWGEGLYRFYPDRKGQSMYERITLHDEKFNSGIFFGMEQDNVNGYFWVLSYSGITVFRLDDDRIAPVNEFISSINDITNIYSDIIKDKNGNLWLGTYEQGAIVVSPNRSSVTNFKLQSIKTETGYIPNVTTAICEDEEGELWFKQSRLGIYLFDTKTARTRRISSVPGVNAIGRCSKQGEIWVAADYVPNIYRFRKANGKVLLTETIELRAILGENTQVVKFLLEDRNGIVWVATHDALLSYRQDQWQIACNDCGTITGIAEDSYGAIWIGTAEKGLLQVIPGNDKPSTKSYNTNTCRIAGNNISCISAGTDGQLWFCVNETRLCNYDITKQQFTDYAQRANASNFVILNIVAGDNERIWISGSKQVVEFNTRTGASIQYDAQKDLTVTSLNKNAVAKRNDGSIVFGGNKGLCIFTPSPQLNLPCKKVKPLITDVKINGKTVYQRDINRQNPDWQKRLILLPAETNIEIDFSSFNYLNPGKIRYAYKLEGVDEQWIYPEPGRNFAVYNQLRKGEYTFLVKSTGDNQLWSNEITPMLVVKKPAFYETGRAYVLYAIVILFILVAVSRLYANRIKLLGELHITQLDKKKQEELIQTKLRFFTNIGHEFRTPLTLIMTPLRTLIGQLTDDKLKQKLSSIYRNAEDMLGLINQLLDFRKLEMDGENLKLSCNDFVKFTHYVYSAFKDIAGNKSIQFTFESDVRQLFMFFDKNKVRKIINNLYSNALKFTSEEGYIATFIRLVQENEREFVCVDIADSGCGIPEKDRQMIFKRFYQSENNDSESTGSGIGLHLAKEYVELHGGQIKVDSEVGKGSVFSIFIPVDLQVIYDNTEKEDPHPESLPVSPETDINRNQEQKTLLIVEDNLELRHFLAEQLGDRFNALQAADGKEGLAAARKKSPDLIVSDLMMPGLNGLEMCRQLKTDIQTSHIPIILLTAKLSDETKIESYKAGADSHIAKPFNFEVLLTRIETLIEQQEKRKKLFHKTIEITPGSITTSSLDEELIKKALLVVEKNMDNSEFSVDELASELAFSRRQLSRKFQSIIGLSPGEFIHSVRLKRAAQLLKDSQYNISEISDRTGFGNIKYFNRYFKEEFGVTPTQYRLENRK